MQPLTRTRQMLTWLSMCSADESTTNWQKLGHIAYTMAVSFVIVIGFVTSLVYCFECISTDFNGAAFAFQIAIGEFGLIYFMINAIQRRQQIGNIFASLSTINESSKFNCNHQIQLFERKFEWSEFTDKNEATLRYMGQANESSEWMWTFYFKYMAALLGGMTATAVLSVLYSYSAQEHFDANHFYRPGNFEYVIEFQIFFSFKWLKL